MCPPIMLWLAAGDYLIESFRLMTTRSAYLICRFPAVFDTWLKGLMWRKWTGDQRIWKQVNIKLPYKILDLFFYLQLLFLVKYINSQAIKFVNSGHYYDYH